MGKLTDVQIKNWVKAGKPVAIADGDGLTFTLSAKGTAAWTLRFYLAGKRKELTLGRYPDMSLSRAREIASAKRVEVQQGVDVAFGLVSQAVERSVAGPVVGDRRLQEPAAVHGPEQVVLRTDGRILVVTVDPGGGHLHCAPCVGR